MVTMNTPTTLQRELNMGAVSIMDLKALSTMTMAITKVTTEAVIIVDEVREVVHTVVVAVTKETITPEGEDTRAVLITVHTTAAEAAEVGTAALTRESLTAETPHKKKNTTKTPRALTEEAHIEEITIVEIIAAEATTTT
jgi:hypothetical protein